MKIGWSANPPRKIPIVRGEEKPKVIQILGPGAGTWMHWDGLSYPHRTEGCTHCEKGLTKFWRGYFSGLEFVRREDNYFFRRSVIELVGPLFHRPTQWNAIGTAVVMMLKKNKDDWYSIGICGEFTHRHSIPPFDLIEALAPHWGFSPELDTDVPDEVRDEAPQTQRVKLADNYILRGLIREVTDENL